MRVCQNTKGRDVRPVRPKIYIDIYLTINCLSEDARAVQCGSNKPSPWRRSAYALQESSRGWSGSATPGNANCIRPWYWSERQRSVLHHGWHSRTLRPASAPKPRLPTTFFRGLRSWLRHSLTHGYFLESLRDSVIRPYLNRIARLVHPCAQKYLLFIASTYAGRKNFLVPNCFFI